MTRLPSCSHPPAADPNFLSRIWSRRTNLAGLITRAAYNREYSRTVQIYHHP